MRYMHLGIGSQGAIWNEAEQNSLTQFRTMEEASLTQRILQLRLEKLRLSGNCD